MIDYNKIAECLKYKAMAMNNAMTTEHPAYKKELELFNELNAEEAKLYQRVSPVNLYAYIRS